MTLYFAYGANMDVAAMKTRAPTAKPLGLARLPRHRLVIMAEGYASVVRDARFAVHGLLWEVSLADIRALDRFEGVDKGLYVKLNQPVVLAASPAKVETGFASGDAARKITPTGAKRAMVYIGQGKAGGRPRPGYLEDVLAAGRALGLPALYLKEIEALAAKPIAAPAMSRAEVGHQDAGPVAGVRPRFSRPGGASRATDQWKWD